MEVSGWLTLDIYVTLIALMLLVISLRRKQKTRQDQSFILLLVTVSVLLVGDMLSRCNPDGRGGALYYLSRFGNYIIFAGDPMGYLATLYYIDSWIHDTRKRNGRFIHLLIIGYVALNFTLITVSDLAGLGWFYSFPDRVYQRGPLFVLRGVLNMVFCLIIGMYILLQKDEIQPEYRKYVISFPLIVLLSGFLQVFVGGAAYEYAGTIFACLLLYFYVQGHNVQSDYLTGLLNRKGIDEELDYRIRRYRSTRPFCTYMLDLDFFKLINDTLGHETGDDALRTLAELLPGAFGARAVCARYGGDEFLIINDAAGPEEAQKCIDRLDALCRQFNTAKNRAYHLSFSAGYDLYTPDRFPSADSYLRHLDQLMYQEKEQHHAIRP